MRIRVFQIVLFAAWSLTAAASVQALPSDYTFTSLIDNSSGYTNITTPVINNRGQVCFKADKGTTQYILRAEPGSLTIIDQGTPGQDLALYTRSINDSGVVAFSRFGFTDISVAGEYFGDGNSVTTIAEQQLGGPPSGWSSYFFRKSAINNDGTVVFEGSRNDVGSGIFAYKNGKTSLIVKETDFAGASLQSLVLNDADNVVFDAIRQSDGTHGLFNMSVAGGTPVAVVRQQDLGNNVTLGGFSVNNSGRVAFSAQSSNSPFTAFTATTDGGGITVIAASTADGVSAVAGGGTPSINDSGEVAFAGGFIVNGKLQGGLFNGSDPQLDRIIGTGDPLFGSTMAGLLQLDPNALNDFGQVAFIYGLANGTVGIAIATPVGVPEPGMAFLLGTLTLIGARRR